MVHDFRETCAMLRVSRSTLNRLCAQRKIGFLQEGKNCKRLFTDDHIKKYLGRLEKRAR